MATTDEARAEAEAEWRHPGSAQDDNGLSYPVGALIMASRSGFEAGAEWASRRFQIAEDMVRVFYYDHSCEWLSKYCDEHHKRSALVPRAALGGGE